MIRFEHPSLEAARATAMPDGAPRGGKRISAPRSASEPLVTVVIAVRNGARHLERALESVFDQSYPDLEVVVADGASTDGTIDLLRRLSSRLDVWVSAPDRGMFDGMNRGVALARGQLIKIHGADDVMPTDSVALAVAAFRAAGRPSNVVVRGDMEIVDQDLRPIVRVGRASDRPRSPAILHPTWYVPLAVYEQHGLYDPHSVVSSDYEMYFHLRERGVTFLHVDAVLSRFQSGGTSSSFAGLTDTYRINARHRGPMLAARVAAETVARRAVRMLLDKAVGTRTTDALRRRMKEGLS